MPVLLPLVAALVPILTLPNLLFYFDVTPKVAVLLLAAAVACCLFRTNAQSLGDLYRTGAGCRLVQIISGITLALIAGTAGSTNAMLSLSGGNWRRFGLVTQLALLVFALLAAAYVVPDMNRLRPTLRVVAATGSVISLYTALQFFGWDPFLPSAAYHIGEGFWTIVRPPGTIGHANYLGTYLIFVVFLSGAMAWTEQEQIWKTLGLAAAGLASFAILLTGARSAMLGLLAGTIVLVLKRRPPVRHVLAGIGIFTALLAGFYYSPWGHRVKTRARWFREDPIGGARLLLWRDSLRLASVHPFVGSGPETFATEFPRVQSIELARAFPDFYHESPHNVFIDELTGKGALGLVSFLLFTGLAVRACARPRGRTEMGLSAAFVAALVAQQFNAFVLTTALFFYLTGAFLIVGSAVRSSNAGTLPRSHLYLAAIAGTCLAILLTVFAVRLLVADYALARVKRMLDSSDPFAITANYATVLRWQLPGTSSDLYYSRSMAPLVRRQRGLMSGVKAWQESVQAAIRATELAEDRHNALYNLASLYGMVNNHADAERSLRRAIVAAPNWFKPRWALARLLKLQGKDADARGEARAALERGGTKFPEVVNTLIEVGLGAIVSAGKEIPASAWRLVT